MITIKDYSYQYRHSSRLALESLSLEIRAGEVLSIVGPSEAGKTTLAYALSGLLEKHFRGSRQSGSIEFSDSRGSNDQSGIGFVFQDVGIQLSGITETVEEEIAFSLEQLGVPQSVIKERTEEQLALFHMHPLRDRHPKSLSGGEAQLLAIASEAAKHPKLFILDEPAQSLDAKNTELLATAIQLWKRSAAVIITEGQLNVTCGVGDRVLFLDHGSLRFLGSPAEMLNSEIDFSTLDLPEWVDAQRLLKRPTISGSYRQSIRWLKEFRSSS